MIDCAAPGAHLRRQILGLQAGCELAAERWKYWAERMIKYGGRVQGYTSTGE